MDVDNSFDNYKIGTAYFVHREPAIVVAHTECNIQRHAREGISEIVPECEGCKGSPRFIFSNCSIFESCAHTQSPTGLKRMYLEIKKTNCRW